MATAPQVILYSTSLHAWEVWSQSRPLAHGSLDSCRDTYPNAEPVSDHQRLIAAADAFLTEHPWLKNAEAVVDLCVEVSEEFTSTLNEQGIAAEPVSGVLMGAVAEFPDTVAVLAGHHAVLVCDEDAVYDWTARQFDPTARVPLIQSLGQWRETWAEIGTKTGAPA